MKKNIFLLSIILFLITACNNDEAEINTGTEDQKNQVTFTTRGDATDEVSVLIFREDQQKTDYYFKEEFKPIWQTVAPSQAKAEKALLLGNYQFLLYRWENDGNTTMTVPEAGKTIIENIRFNAKPDDVKTNELKTKYVLPVDPVWLPATTEANNKYRFDGIIKNETVKQKLERAVSLVEVYLRRGYKNDPSDPEYTRQPYNMGKSIRDHFDKITLDIKKVGTSVGVNGNYGSAGTYVSNIAGETLIDPVHGDEGFAFFGGPLVFPNENEDDDSEVIITLTPNQDPDNPYKEKTITVKGKLQRNKKLEIKLWLSSTYKHIEVIVDIKPIEKEEDGDVGIWE